MNVITKLLDIIYHMVICVIMRIYQQLQGMTSRHNLDHVVEALSSSKKPKVKVRSKSLRSDSKIPDLIEDEDALKKINELRRRKLRTQQPVVDDGIELVGSTDLSPTFVSASNESAYPENWVVYDIFLGLILKKELEKIQAQRGQREPPAEKSPNSNTNYIKLPESEEMNDRQDVDSHLEDRTAGSPKFKVQET